MARVFSETAHDFARSPRRAVVTTAAAMLVVSAVAGCTRQDFGLKPNALGNDATTDVVKYVYAQHGDKLSTVSCGPGGVIKSVTDTEHESPTSLFYASVTNPENCMDDTVKISKITANSKTGVTNFMGKVIAYAPSTGFVLHSNIVVGSDFANSPNTIGITASRPFSPDKIGQLQRDFSNRGSAVGFLQDVISTTGIITDKNPQWLANHMDSIYILRGTQAAAEAPDIGDPAKDFRASFADFFRKDNLAGSALDGDVVTVSDPDLLGHFGLLDAKSDQIVITYGD